MGKGKANTPFLHFQTPHPIFIPPTTSSIRIIQHLFLSPLFTLPLRFCDKIKSNNLGRTKRIEFFYFYFEMVVLSQICLVVGFFLFHKFANRLILMLLSLPMSFLISSTFQPWIIISIYFFLISCFLYFFYIYFPSYHLLHV